MKSKEVLANRKRNFILDDIKKAETNIIAFESKILNFFVNYRYPKITILILVIILAYFIFSNSSIQDLIMHLNNLSYIGVFIAGLFFTFGFTSPFSAGFFIVFNPDNLFLSALVGGFGALVGDLFIFKFIRFSFQNEFTLLEREKMFMKLEGFFNRSFSHKIRLFFLYALAFFFISSPLPDEAGVIILAGLTKIHPKIFSIISFVANTSGIFILLLL
jgi:hypothetical protein